MSKIESQNRISGADEIFDKSTPKKPESESENKTLENKKIDTKPVDLNDLHQASKKYDESIDEIAARRGTDTNKKPNTDLKMLGFFEKFLHDNWGVRMFFALGNEIAESFYELADHLLPSSIAKSLYAGFWSLAVVATGSRVVSNAQHAKSEDKFKAGGKMLLHDGMSAIVAPTAVARIMNAIQNKLYAPLPIPETLKHLIKSIVSIFACKFTVHGLDPIAMKISGQAFNHTNDRHKQINLAFGSHHGNDKKSETQYSTAA